MMRPSLFGLILLFLLPGLVWAAPKSRCPEKVLSSGTVEGVYQGVECFDFCHVLLKLDSGEEVDFLWGVDEAEKYLGPKGSRVSVNFEKIQFWNEYGEECTSAEVIKSGKIVPTAPPPAAKPGPKPEPGVRSDPIGPRIKGFQLGTTEAEFLETAKRHFPYVERVYYLNDHGPPVTLYILALKDPETTVGSAGVSLAGVLRAIRANTAKGVECDVAMIYDALIHVAEFYSLALAFFDYDRHLLQKLELTGSTLDPLFNMSPSPAEAFMEAFTEGYQLPAPRRSQGQEYALRPDDLKWEITFSLTEADLKKSPRAAVTKISLERKYYESTTVLPRFD